MNPGHRHMVCVERAGFGPPRAGKRVDRVLGRQRLFYEDFEVGMVLETGQRTVTESDIVAFACLSGDFNDVHTNRVFIAEKTTFGAPIAHGPLIYAICAGLNFSAGFAGDTVVAVSEVSRWRLLRPVFAGDTVRMSSEVVSLKVRDADSSKKGLVTFHRQIHNQKNEIVQEMTVGVFYLRRTAPI